MPRVLDVLRHPICHMLGLVPLGPRAQSVRDVQECAWPVLQRPLETGPVEVLWVDMVVESTHWAPHHEHLPRQHGVTLWGLSRHV